MQDKTFIITEDIIASKSVRFCNYLIDYVIRLLLIFVFAIGVAFIATLTDSYAVLEWMETMNRIEEYVVGIVFALIYYNLTEIFFKGRSIGKFITGTVVVMEDGSIPDNNTILKRTICRVIPFDALSFLGYRGWHDSISETYVVNKNELDQARSLFYSFEELGKTDEVQN